jgi:DNA repair protein SbcD/Mre11
MKLVFFSDLHLDSAFTWVGGGSGAARRRRQALRQTLMQILDLAVVQQADAVLCGGDLYEHERFSPDTEQFLRASFESIHPIRVFISPGNHDWCGPGSIYKSVRWSPNVHVYDDERLAPVELDDGITLWGGAHLAPAGTRGFLDGFKADRSGINLGLFHGSEVEFLSQQESGKQAHAPFRARDVELAGLDYAFVGHYHNPHDGQRHSYPGNPEPLSFGEQGNRGAVIFSISSSGERRLEKRNVAMTQAHDLAVDVTGCTNRNEVYELVLKRVAGLTGIARITLNGEVSEHIDLDATELEDVRAGLDAMTVRTGTLRPPYDVEAIAIEPTVRGQFVKDVLASDLPPDMRRQVLMTGLRALDGRNDLEVP